MEEMAFILIVIIIANLVIGTSIGISGIAGFLLPLIYVGILDMELRNALALSFLAFFLGGIFGAYSYWKLGNLDLKFANLLSIGSFFGAFVGVWLNVLIPTHIAKLILYIVVLLSGLSILLRKDNKEAIATRSELLKSKRNVIFLGFITATICSLTGAGGPILVVPILTVLGVNIKLAVGIAIFNSIIIAIPASVGYLLNSNLTNMGILIVSSLVAHIIGMLFGANISNRINISILKKIVSIISISSALYMLISTLIA